MLRRASLILLGILVLATTAWAVLALWFRLPVPELVRAAAAGGFGLLGLATVLSLLGRNRFRVLAVFAVGFGLVLAWWATIQPPRDGDWSPDVARQVTGTIDGNSLTLTGVRDFTWRSTTDFTENWTTRSYDLSKLRSMDLFMSYWAGPEIAHTLLSFGFDGGEQLVWSIEVRRRKGEQFSAVADAFKSHPLVILAADERDLVGLRSNVRGEDVQIYRLRTPPDKARALLLQYVADANALAAEPEFYNSITTNCTTVIVKMVQALDVAVPFDWRLLVNGYLPDYAYDRGALDTRVPLSELRARSHIDQRARARGLTPGFSAVIREGVPSPLE